LDTFPNKLQKLLIDDIFEASVSKNVHLDLEFFFSCDPLFVKQEKRKKEKKTILDDC